MPILKNALKKMRQDSKKTQSNLALKTGLKTVLAKAKRTGTVVDFQKAISTLDKAAKKNLIHKNKASRQKSRLAHLLKDLKPDEKAEVKPKKRTTKKVTSNKKL